MENKIDYLRIEPADNGIIISYDEYVKKPGSEKQSYDMPCCMNRKEVFDFESEEGESEEKFNEAFERFKELFKRYRNQKK